MIPLRALALVSLALLLSAAGSSPAPASRRQAADAVLIRDVRVVDARSTEASAPTCVLLEAGVIRAIGPGLEAPDGALVVDGSGCWLIPGLWDLHAHLSQCGARGLELFVALGVTGVRDMGGELDTVRGWQSQIEEGSRIGPMLRVAGPVLETAGFVGMVDRLAGMLSEADGAALRASVAGRIGVASPAEARAAVQRLAEMGVDHVKVRSAASVEVYQAIAAAAREAGLDLVGHAPEQVVPVLECARAGQRSVEHTSFAVGPSMLTAADLDELAEALLAAGTVLVPTLVADECYRLTADADLRAHIDGQDGSPRRRYATDEMLAFWNAQMAMKRFEGPIDWAGMHANSIGLLRTLREKGVPLLPGTDLGVVEVYPGFGLHDELGLMAAKLGMSPHELLSAATWGAAKLVRMDERLGTVEAGKLANLVLLEADPLQDVAHLARIRAVSCGPRWLDRAALDACLARAAGEDGGGDGARPEDGRQQDGGEAPAGFEVPVAVDPTNPERIVAAFSHDGARSFRTTAVDQPDFEFGGRGFFGDDLGLDAAGGRVVAAYAWYDGPKTAISAAVLDFQPGTFRAPPAR